MRLLAHACRSHQRAFVRRQKRASIGIIKATAIAMPFKCTMVFAVGGGAGGGEKENQDGICRRHRRPSFLKTASFVPSPSLSLDVMRGVPVL
jgi:hypothetical protein